MRLWAFFYCGLINASGNLESRYEHGLGLIAKDEDFYTFDGNGNTSEMTNAKNEIVNFYIYEPFGKSLYEVETTDNDFKFVGQFGLMAMGEDLIYMRNRFYEPSTGRFMSEDPIALAGGDVNFIRYVQNDPVNWVDPLGLYGLDTLSKPSSVTKIEVAILSGDLELARDIALLAGITAAELAIIIDEVQEDVPPFPTPDEDEPISEPITHPITEDVPYPVPCEKEKDKEDNHEHCMRLYMLCDDQQWQGNCGQCLQYCKV